jgi:hypothetical protein
VKFTRLFNPGTADQLESLASDELLEVLYQLLLDTTGTQPHSRAAATSMALKATCFSDSDE